MSLQLEQEMYFSMLACLHEKNIIALGIMHW